MSVGNRKEIRATSELVSLHRLDQHTAEAMDVVLEINWTLWLEYMPRSKSDLQNCS